MQSIPTRDAILALLVIVLGASGTYLMLPHRLGSARPRRVHLAGGILAAVALVLLAMFWTPPGGVILDGFFYVFAAAAIGCGALTVTSRNPIYSALWFAAVVLATSGLFLLCGAQFLAAGTIIVYAGAIIVTFLFVIMLAQTEGRAVYDRMARSPAKATFTSFLLFWSLLYAILGVRTPANLALTKTEERPYVLQGVDRRLPAGDRLATSDRSTGAIYEAAVPPTQRLFPPTAHVAGLGRTLYTDHLITVELAGALLFVALVGALAIASPKPPTRPADRRVATADPYSRI